MTESSIHCKVGRPCNLRQLPYLPRHVNDSVATRFDRNVAEFWVSGALRPLLRQCHCPAVESHPQPIGRVPLHEPHVLDTARSPPDVCMQSTGEVSHLPEQTNTLYGYMSVPRRDGARWSTSTTLGECFTRIFVSMHRKDGVLTGCAESRNPVLAPT